MLDSVLNFVKKETTTPVFSSEIYKIFKDDYFEENPANDCFRQNLITTYPSDFRGDIVFFDVAFPCEYP